MEGVGEGLVAIVHGLENSGVTLTVCNRSRHNNSSDVSRPSGPRIQINGVNNRSDMLAADQRQNTVPAVTAPPGLTSTQPAVQRSSVETSTGSDFSRMATASQICDGRYASSYKLAHCMMSPTSPPEAVTEFPPQRKEPCRNKGNFEIGGQNRVQWSGYGLGHNVSAHGSGPGRVSTSRPRHYGGTQTWGDKGSSHRYSKSNHRETDAFAHSLRKYPSMAPFRTASTDLIEKLIRYTQAKNYQEMSRSTKSMRSLRNQKSSETNDTNRVSTHQQTYTRRQDDNFRNNSHVQIGYRGRTRNFKLYSPVSDSRNFRETRYRKTTVTGSYDYLKAGNAPHGRSNRSDSSPSPTRSRSPEGCRSPERSCSPGRIKSPDRFRSPDGSRLIRTDRSSRPLRFERSVRDLSLSEMSKYIRSTIKQIYNERPVVVQVCPKLKDRYNQHRKVFHNKKERTSDIMELEEQEYPEGQASGSILSRFLQSFSGRSGPSTEQAGCQCTRTDCYCTKKTQCVNNPTATTNTATCSCTSANTGCCRGMPCLCASKSQDQAYYDKRIDEEVSEWLKDVPVHSIENTENKTKRETIVKELRKTLKKLPDDENFEENATNEIQGFVDDFPLWNPGKDENDEKLFKNQLADKLAEKIVAIPRKPDRFRDIVKKWVVNIHFEDDGEEVNMEAIIDNFVNRLKFLAADRPACDIKYTNLLRKEIIELLVELAVKVDGDMLMLKKVANSLATEIVSIPRYTNLGETSDLASEFEENIADWICEHGLCEELKKDPKLIENLAKKLNKLKYQGIFDEDVIEKMREEVQRFVDDVGLSFEIIEELITQLSSTIQMKAIERLDLAELNEEISNWLRSLPGASDLHPRKFEKITKEIVKIIQESIEQENENLANDIVDYLVHTDLSIDSVDLGIYVEELMEHLSILPSNKYYREQAKRVMLKGIYDIIERSPIPEETKEEMRRKAHQIVENSLLMSSFNLRLAPDDVKETLLRDMDDFVSDIDIPKENRLKLKSLLSTSINNNFDKSFTTLSRNRSDLKKSIASDVRNVLKKLLIDTDKKKDLMQQVKGTLSKNMNKPLPSNVKNNINDEICDVVERCPICEDRNILSRIKKVLSEVASKHLTIYLPKCVCDIQNEVEEDVSVVIDRSEIDNGKKRELKENIQDILTENKDRRLTDEVIRAIKDGISSVVSDLSIPRDKKDVLKKAVGETVSKDFKEAGKAFRHDLNKIRNKILDDITNVIEKSPIQRNAKSHLKDKLITVLAKNLDSSLSDEEKHMILDDVSDIVRYDMPEEKRRSLTNKLAKKLDTHQRKEKIEGLTKNINRLSIDSSTKDDMNKAIKAMLLNTLYYPLSEDVQQQINEDVQNVIDGMDMPELDKKNLKSNISHAMAKELEKLIAQNKEVPEIKAAIEKKIAHEIKNSTICKDRQELLVKKLKDVLTDNLVRAITDEVRETIKERLGDIVDDLITDGGKADAIKTQLLNIVDKDLDRSAKSISCIQSYESLWEKQQTNNLKELENETQENILRDIEQVVDEAPIPKEKKIELKKKLENVVIKNFKRPLEDVAEGLKDDTNVILDELNFSKDKENKLKSELTAAVDKNTNDLQGANGANVVAENLKKPFSEHVKDGIKNEMADLINDLHIPKSKKTKLKTALTHMVDEIQVGHLKELEDKILNDIFEDMERAIEEAPIPGEKKIELKKKFWDLATKACNNKSLDEVAKALKVGIIEIIDELNLPKDKKNKLESALINMIDENMDILRSEPCELPTITKRPLEDMAEGLKEDINKIVDDQNLPKENKNTLKSQLTAAVDRDINDLQGATAVDKTKVKDNIFQGIEKIIEESAVPEEKKMESKIKLKKLAAENLKKPVSTDVQDVISNGIANIINDLPTPKSEKNKVESDNSRGGPRKLPTQDESVHDIFQEIEQTIEEVSTPGEKKIELKEKLKKPTYKDFNKIPLEDVAEALIDDKIEIIDDLNLPKDKQIKSAPTGAVGEYVSNFKTDGDEKKKKKVAAENLKKPFSENVQDGIKNGIADIIDDLPIPKSEKNALTNMVDENAPQKMPIEVDHLKELKDKPLHNIFLDMEQAIKEAPIHREKKIELIKKLRDLATKDFNNKSLDDVAKALKVGMIEIINELNLPKDKKNKLESAITNMIDENMDILDSEPFERPSQDDYLKELGKSQRNILQGFEKVVEEAPMTLENKMELKKKLKDIAIKNFKKPLSYKVAEALIDDIFEIIDELNLPQDTKNKLINGLSVVVNENMSNLKSELSPLADELIEKTREMGQKEGAEDFLKARENINYVDKLKEHTGDDQIAPVHNDKIIKYVEAFAKAINNAVDQSTLSKLEKSSLKKKLLNKLRQTIDQSVNINDIRALNDEVLKDCKEIIDASSIPAGKKNEIIFLFKKELPKAFGDEILDEEEGPVVLELAPEERPIVPKHKDKITKYKEAFAKAINNVVDQSTVSKLEKSSLKNKLLSKLRQTIDQSANINDIRLLNAEVLKDCKKIIDESSIPAGKKKGLKLLLKKELASITSSPNVLFGEEVMDDYDDEEEVTLEESPTAEEYKEKITETIKTWMTSLPLDWDPEVATTVAEDLASDIMDRQKYLQAHPEAISADNDEIENLKYQVFRRMNNLVDPKDIPLIMERTENLYRMNMDIEPPTGVPKLRQTSSRG